MKTLQKGFTLIELVIVIIILGILAAIAVPRFVDMSREAAIAATQSVAGSISSGSAINQAQWKLRDCGGTPTGDCTGAKQIDTANGNGTSAACAATAAALIQGGAIDPKFQVAASTLDTTSTCANGGVFYCNVTYPSDTSLFGGAGQPPIPQATILCTGS